MATVTRGKNYGATETVTNTNLHQLVDSATVTSIDSVDFDLTTTNPVHVGTSAPSDTDQRPWYDTTNNVFRIKDGAGVYQPVSRGHFFTNKDAGTVAIGDVVIIDTSNDNAVKRTTTATDTLVFGVILVGGAADAEVIVITEGYCPSVKVTGSTNNGDYLFTSTTTGKADPSASFGQGAFARALNTSASAVIAQLGGATMIANISGSRFAAIDEVSSTVSTASSTTSVVSHGLGVVPTEITIYAAISGGANDGFSSGRCVIIGGSTFQQSSLSQASNGSGTGPHIVAAGDIGAFYDTTSSNSFIGVITAVTTTNFTITWTKSGTPASQTWAFAAVLAG